MLSSPEVQARQRRDSLVSLVPPTRDSLDDNDGQESLHALLPEDNTFDVHGEHVFPRLVEGTKWWKIYTLHFLFMWNTRTFEYVSVGASGRLC